MNRRSHGVSTLGLLPLLAFGCGGTAFDMSAPDATTEAAAPEAGAGPEGGAREGGPSVDGGAADVTVADAPPAGDSATDGSVADAPMAETGAADVAVGDAGEADVVGADGACDCVPYWCGCGQCDPAQIACTVNPPPCVRGCLSSCPELQQTTCTCDRGHCVRSGVDASLGCLRDDDCPVGDCCSHVGPVGPGVPGSCVTAPNLCCGARCP